MKCPDNMMLDECYPDRSLSDDEKRAACLAYLEEIDEDVPDFFECYIDPEGPMRYGGDAWDALGYLMRVDVDTVFQACQQDAKENPR